ncbi:uncharacterized protein LOC144148261 [Haemaphysalis longicornis]
MVVLRSESWRQVRHFTDCLKVACTYTTNGLVNVKAFCEWRRQANNLTEALWNYARPHLPKKQKKVASERRLLVLGEATVEERQQEVLKLGPKFCVEPRLDIVDRLALTRDVARYVPEKEKDRCLVECVDVVAKAPVSRLREAAYPLHVLQASCERLLRKLKHVQEVTPEECAQRSKVTVIPYVHGLSHRLKKVTENYDVNVVFSAKNKIGSVCSRVKQKYEGKDKYNHVCNVKHKLPFVECVKNVVYRIPLLCGHVYVGQTGRCLYIRLREHATSLKGRPYTHLATHCKECKKTDCAPSLEETSVLFSNPKQNSREIVEAFLISQHKYKCISHPSMALLDKELTLLSPFL